MLTVDWGEVGAVATAVAALGVLLVVVAVTLLARATRAVARRSDEVVRSGQATLEVAGRQAELAQEGWRRAGEATEALEHQVAAAGRMLVATQTPLLVAARLAEPGRADLDQPLQTLLPDGVYYAPVEQAVGAWTVEIGSRTLVVACAFRNAGLGPAVLHQAHRIDLVRRGSDEPLYSFRGYAHGVLPVGAKALVGFPMSASDPAHGHTLMLLDRPDDEVQLLVTVYYRSAAAPRTLWTRTRYQRHLRTSPAGLLSELSLEVTPPEEPQAGEPKNPAPSKAKIPPSAPTSQ